MKRIIVILLLVAFCSVGCKTTGGRFDINQAIAITQLALTVAEQGLEIYQIQLDRATGREMEVAQIELQLKKDRINFLREQLTELLKARTAK